MSAALTALHRADLDGALAALQDEVRSAPDDARHRIFLFQLLSVLGDWKRALTQLHVAGDLDPEATLMAKTYQEVLNCEVLRQEVFAGRRQPLVLGEPDAWIAKAIEAQRLSAHGDHQAAKLLREEAWDDAPAATGTITIESQPSDSGEPSTEDFEFAWIADGDTRLGPLLEAIVDGRYYWVPFDRIQSIEIDAPADLRDFVWAPARFVWANQGQAPGMIPTRYVGSESDEDAEVRLARRTYWRDVGADGFEGAGQRVLATDVGEYSLLSVRRLQFATDA